MQRSYFYTLKIEIMKTKIMNFKFDLLGYLLFLPFILFLSCQESIEEISLDAETAINQDSKLVSLMKLAVKSNDDDDNDSDDDDQCVEFKYPIAFYAYYTGSRSISTIVINNDEALITFFDEMTSTDQLNIDFPLELIGTDDEVTMMYSLAELEGTLQIAVDACRGEGDHDYCDDKSKKVYICHNGHTICISKNALWSHLNNHEDDYEGKCEDDDDNDNDD